MAWVGSQAKAAEGAEFRAAFDDQDVEISKARRLGSRLAFDPARSRRLGVRALFTARLKSVLG